MGKKLVKTAKQQFEERMKEFNVTTTFKLCESEIYYLCEDSKAHVYMLREQGDECRELRYGMQYEALVFGERFLSSMTERFAELGVLVKPLFDWYASADHDGEPFSLFDIFMCDLEEENIVYEDIYEEEPDVKIITAREQWEADLEGATEVAFCTGQKCFVRVTDQCINFYVYDGEYRKETYPPLEELRKDPKFIAKYLKFVLNNHDSDIESAISWVEGGEYTMDELTLLDIRDCMSPYGIVCYKDKEESSCNVLPDPVTVMNMYAPFSWLIEAGNGEWEWISEFCDDVNEYGRLDSLYRIIEGSLDVKDEFCNPPTMEEIKADYQKNFPLLLANVFENLASAIRKGEIGFVMDYSKR